MNKFFPTQEIISLFNVSPRSRQSTQSVLQTLKKPNFLYKLLSVFLVVIASAILLNFFNQWLESRSSITMPVAVEEGLAAFQPGSYVRQELQKGYFQ